jgi:hypothetical protein
MHATFAAVPDRPICLYPDDRQRPYFWSDKILLLVDAASILGCKDIVVRNVQIRRELMKKLMLLAAMLALVLVAAAPVIAQSVGFDDQEFESGGIETETSLSIEGNNNNQCAGLLQFGQTGNFGNEQGTSQYDISDEFEQEFEGPETEFAPENGTECEQAVQQAAAASSFGS